MTAKYGAMRRIREALAGREKGKNAKTKPNNPSQDSGIYLAFGKAKCFGRGRRAPAISPRI
jgi:hypothetical protein